MDKQTGGDDRERSSLLPVSPLPRLSFQNPSPYRYAILYLPPPPPPLTVRSTLAAMVVVEVAVEVATAAAIATVAVVTAAVAPPRQHYDRAACFRSRASTLLFPSAGAQSVVAVGVRWLKGNGFESGATPIKDKHVVS